MNERLNIRRMQVPEMEDKEDMPFDPEKDITLRDWKQIGERFEELRRVLSEQGTRDDYFESRANQELFSMAGAIAQIDPRKLEDLHLTRDEFEKGTNILERSFDHGHSHRGNLYAAFPEYRDEIRFSNEDFEKRKSYIYEDGRCRIYPWWEVDFGNVLCLARMRPKEICGIFEEETTRSNSGWAVTREYIRSGARDSDDSVGWYSAKVLATAKLLFGKTIDDMVKPGDWKDLRKMLHKRDKWEPYLTTALQLKIVAAEKIVPTDSEINIVMPKGTYRERPASSQPESLSI
jgi:hypothetical protein